ncbi:MAG: hypothetical protein K0S01_183 [Herbinix sp.]|jgi:hypothetical protein|nr:hypothetical protein [Herbinix sp.]
MLTIKKGGFMNNGVIQINNSLSSQALSLQIAKQCAPLLTGIKISNILITHSSNMKKIEEIFRQSFIKVKCIYMEDERITLLLYKQDELCSYINRQEIQLLMTKLGYGDMDTDYILEGCAHRFSAHKKERSQFPHELGLLLGYPVADVVGFMENYGRNSLYSGYWKVYSDLQGALDTFHQYKKAKELVTHLVLSGVSINGILNQYQTGNNTFNLNQLIAV